MSAIEILWDEYGIPHIFAPDHRGLFYAYGYAQMEAHGELLARLYAQGRGRAAEFYGSAWLEDDRWVRTNGIPRRAARWAAQQSAGFAALLGAFVAGLNASATAQGESLGPAARRVLPFTVTDVLAHTMRVIHFEWLASRQRVARSESNGWAIGPPKSVSGHAMLLSNSHLQWGDRHTYFEVQLTAPGVTSYGAVWVGFPVLRQCFTEYLGWTQTTNGPCLATLYRLSLKGGGYELDGSAQPFAEERQVIRVLQEDGTLHDEPLTVRRSAHGPVVAEQEGGALALRVAGTARPRMLEQFWRMGLARDLEQFHGAMRMQQLPLFNTMYADRDGHIMYLYNAALPQREPRDAHFWCDPVPGNDSALIWSADVVPYAELPKVIDPPGGWVQNCNDSPWTCTHPMALDPADWTPHIDPKPRHTPRAQRSIRLLSRPGRISLDDLKAMKLSTRVELADHFVDDLVAAAQRFGSERARRAAGVLQRWDRATENGSDGALLFYRFVGAAGEDFTTIGGYGVPPDPGQPLTTPRGFAAPERAVAALDAVADGLEREYRTLQVRWGDVVRLRRGSLDLPGNGAPNELGAIRTSGLGPFSDGSAEIVSGDTFYAVVEFSDPARGESLIGYGNWSRAGSQHVSDQLELASQKRMRPILRQRREIEAALEYEQGLAIG